MLSTELNCVYILDTRLYTVEINKFAKFGTKYSMHNIVYVKHWEMCTNSSEGCIATECSI